MDQKTEDFLYNAVEQFMQNGTAFTSLDIANIAKDASYRIRNHEVANWLRSNAITISFDGGYLYNQSLIQVDSKAVGMTLAYCYHYYNDSSDDYLDRDQNPKSFMKQVNKSNVLASLPSPGSSILAQINSTSDDTIYFDSREAARTYARTYSDQFKFKDFGWSANNLRWACEAR